jgi:hypothetical protein
MDCQSEYVDTDGHNITRRHSSQQHANLSEWLF